MDRGDRAEPGGYARASYASGGGDASRAPRIAGDVTAGSALTSCCAGGLRPVRGKAPLSICSGAASRRGLLMGVQLGGKVIWAGLQGCGCCAGTGGQQREAVTVLP